MKAIRPVFRGSVFALLFLLAATAAAKDTQVLRGWYASGSGENQNLEATFRATGAQTWDVTFRFTFQGESRTWQGSAVGSLSEGSLSGRVKATGMDRVFVFEGSFRDGVFSGNHAELHGRREEPTGSMTLGP